MPVVDAEIMIAEFYPHNLRCLMPIAQELERRGVKLAWLAGRRSVADELARREVHAPVALLQRFAPVRTAFAQRLRAEERAALDRAIRALPDDVIGTTPRNPAGRAARQGLLERHLVGTSTEAAYWIEAYDAALARLRPLVMLTCVHMGIHLRSCVSVARARGVRTGFVQHGLVLDYPMYRFYAHERTMMWGEFERRHLVGLGHAPESVKVVGSPLYDGLIAKVKARGPRPFPAPGQPLKIVFLPTRSEGFTLATGRAVLGGVVDAIATIPEAELTLKPHPNDRTTIPEEVIARHPRFTLVRVGDAGKMVLEADLVVVYASTTGNEACLADRPLIVLGTSATDYSIFTEYGAALRVEEPKDLAAAIRALQTDPARREALALGRRKLIDDMLNGGRGDAASRVADELADLGR